MNQRLFIAVDLPDEQRRAIGGLPPPPIGARRANLAQLHITLRFLGDTPEEEIPALTTRLESVRQTAFPVEPCGLGVFPNHRAPRVLWVGLTPHEPLCSLHAAIVAALGAPADPLPFHPHLTLARLGPHSAQETRKFLAGYAEFRAGVFTVDAFHLYRSRLEPSGAIHQKIATFFLAPPPFPS